jgi:hypothetical protein
MQQGRLGIVKMGVAAAVAVIGLAGCSAHHTATVSKASQPTAAAGAATASPVGGAAPSGSSGALAGLLGGGSTGGPGETIKVPFGGDACKALTAAQLMTLGEPTTGTGQSTKLSNETVDPSGANNYCAWNEINVTFWSKTGYADAKETDEGHDTPPVGMPSGAWQDAQGDVFDSVGGYNFSVGESDSAAKALAMVATNVG